MMSARSLGHIFLFFLLLSNYSISAQTIDEIKTDTLNKFDSKGKRDGYWIDLLNEKLEPVKKKKKAIFFRFIYYDQGCKLDNFNSHTFGTNILQTSGNNSIKGEIVLLNGEYKFFNKYGRLIFIENYTNGKKSGIYKSYSPNMKIFELADYEKKYNSQEHSFYLMFDENENGDFRFKGYYRKGKKGWSIYPEK